MKSVTVAGDVSTFQGVTLPEKVPYSKVYEEFLNPQEVKDAKEWPSETDIMGYVNDARKMKARAEATADALKAKFEATQDPVYRKIDPNSAEGARELLVKQILKSNKKMSREKAEKMADSLIAAEG